MYSRALLDILLMILMISMLHLALFAKVFLGILWVIFPNRIRDNNQPILELQIDEVDLKACHVPLSKKVHCKQ